MDACVFLVICCLWHGNLPRLIVVLAFPFHFLDNHCIVGFSTFYFVICAKVPYGCGLSYYFLELFIGTNVVEALEQLGLSY